MCHFIKILDRLLPRIEVVPNTLTRAWHFFVPIPRVALFMHGGERWSIFCVETTDFRGFVGTPVEIDESFGACGPMLPDIYTYRVPLQPAPSALSLWFFSRVGISEYPIGCCQADECRTSCSYSSSFGCHFRVSLGEEGSVGWYGRWWILHTEKIFKEVLARIQTLCSRQLLFLCYHLPLLLCPFSWFVTLVLYGLIWLHFFLIHG